MTHAQFRAFAPLFAPALAAILLAGCGGGGGEPAAGTAVAIAAASPSPTSAASPVASPTPTATPAPTPSASPASQAASTASCGLTPVFMEEFNDLSVAPYKIGPARWTAHTAWNGDFGDARFTDPGPDGPFKVENGILSITAKKDANGKWTAGLLSAADASGAGSGTQYGYFEARMKMPPGTGVWPAFWLHSLKPAAGSDGDVEIDVIEYYGQFDYAYQATTHVWWWSNTSKQVHTGHRVDVTPGSLTADYHTYGVDISPESLTYMLDGKAVWTDKTPPEINSAMYPLINLGLGGGWLIDATPNPSVLLVDYIHVYGRNGGPPPGCSPGPPR